MNTDIIWTKELYKATILPSREYLHVVGVDVFEGMCASFWSNMVNSTPNTQAEVKKRTLEHLQWLPSVCQDCKQAEDKKTEEMVTSLHSPVSAWSNQCWGRTRHPVVPPRSRRQSTCCHHPHCGASRRLQGEMALVTPNTHMFTLSFLCHVNVRRNHRTSCNFVTMKWSRFSHECV